jgi:hypothetical protein
MTNDTFLCCCFWVKPCREMQRGHCARLRTMHGHRNGPTALGYQQAMFPAHGGRQWETTSQLPRGAGQHVSLHSSAGHVPLFRQRNQANGKKRQLLPGAWVSDDVSAQKHAADG